MVVLTCEKRYIEKFYLIYVLKDNQEIPKLGDREEEARRIFCSTGFHMDINKEI